jgi:peptidase M50-like protein
MIDNALEWFVQVMDSNTLLFVSLAMWPLVFLLIVVHELGHALVALVCTESLVEVRVGRAPGVVRGRIGRLAYSFDLRRDHRAKDEALTTVLAHMSRGEVIAYAVGGPAANAILAVFLAPLALSLSGLPRDVVWAGIVLSASGTILNLVSLPGSDGRMALAAIRGEIPSVDGESPLSGDIVNELGRWMALYTNAQDPRFSKQRAYLFGIAPLELGVDPRTSFDDASHCWSTARAGWCWREVRPAPAHALADLPKRAWKSQSLEGLRGLDLAAAAAAEVARSSSRTYADPDVETAFVATTELRAAVPMSDDASRFAFEFGVALHDVERVMEQHGQRYW